MNRFIAPLAFFFILLGFLAVGLTLKPRELPSPLINRAAPEFVAAQLLSAQPFIVSQMKGEVWLLNVWAEWCAACLDEHPHLLRLAREQVTIVGLNYKDDAARARAWLDEHGNPYAHIAVDADGDIGVDYGVYGVPETYVIDAAGVIRFKHIGPLNEKMLRRDLLPLIRQLREAA